MEIVNLPLDESGNLKVSRQEKESKTVVVFDDDIFAVLHEYTYIASFDPENYKYMNVMAQVSELPSS